MTDPEVPPEGPVNGPKPGSSSEGSATAAPPTRPAFAIGFPRSAPLDGALEAFVRGDYALARKQAERLAQSATDDDIKRAARTLAERTHPDPLGVLLLALATALLLLLGGWWIAYAKPPSAHPPAVTAPRE
jgi:hypothetical protein